MPSAAATACWDDFLAGRTHLLIWEAFASNKTKDMRHDKDAKAIVQALRHWIEKGNGIAQITAVHPVSPAGRATCGRGGVGTSGCCATHASCSK